MFFVESWGKATSFGGGLERSLGGTPRKSSQELSPLIKESESALLCRSLEYKSDGRIGGRSEEYDDVDDDDGAVADAGEAVGALAEGLANRLALNLVLIFPLKLFGRFLPSEVLGLESALHIISGDIGGD